METRDRTMGKVIMSIIFWLISADALAREIKPGIIITKDNLNRYSTELKQQFIPGYFDHIIKWGALQRGDITIPVVKPKWKYMPPPGFQEANRKNREEKRCRVGEGNQLIGYDDAGGLPFPDPQNGVELAWNAYRNRGAQEDKDFVADFRLFNANGKQERWFSWHLWKKMWIGRTDIPPIPQMANNNGVIDSKESIIIDRPHDVKGFCMIRIRYTDIKKADDCYSYIPALRRIRRLTGSDLTDPLLGSDAIPDDFECWRQKINPQMTFQSLGIKKFLVPRQYTTEELPNIRGKRPPGYISGTGFQVEWEVRPFYVLVVNTNDPDYPYQKRIVYVESQDGIADLYGGDNYDHRGRLCHTNTFTTHNFDPRTHFIGWCGSIYLNSLTGHSSMLDMYFDLTSELDIPFEVFTIRGLLRKAR